MSKGECGLYCCSVGECWPRPSHCPGPMTAWIFMHWTVKQTGQATLPLTGWEASVHPPPLHSPLPSVVGGAASMAHQVAVGTRPLWGHPPSPMSSPGPWVCTLQGWVALSWKRRAASWNSHSPGDSLWLWVHKSFFRKQKMFQVSSERWVYLPEKIFCSLSALNYIWLHFSVWAESGEKQFI